MGDIRLTSKAKNLAILVLLTLCLLASCGTGQVSEALVRGHFSGGSGTWYAEDFGWFYYDLDENVGGERLEIVVDGYDIEKGKLAYTSEVWTEKFEFEDWGRYQAVAFLGKRYLAGYLESNFTDAVSSLEEGQLREVLIDGDKYYSVTADDPLILADNYQFNVEGVSSEGDGAYITLQKDGNIIDEAVVQTGETYVYKVGDDDLPVLLIHISNVFCGRDCGIIDLDGIFQVRHPSLTELEIGDVLGLLEISDISGQTIELRNNVDISLHRDSEISLAGGLKLKVKDKPSLIYYPIGVFSEYGVRGIRGPTYSERSSITTQYIDGTLSHANARWNSENFSGFYFDEDKDLGTESLIIFDINDRKIRPIRLDGNGRQIDGIQYMTFAETLEFEFEDWGSYRVVSLFGQLWFAGYDGSTSPEIDRVSMIENEQIGQVLIDTDQKDVTFAGDIYFLEEGYKLYIRDLAKDDVEKEKIFIALLKNDKLVDTAVIGENSTYSYETDVGEVDDVPIIILHVGEIFSDGDKQFAMINGLFQLSDRLYLPVESGKSFGELTVLMVNSKYIFMTNTDTLTLKRDDHNIRLLPGISIAVADDEKLRYNIYRNEYVVPLPRVIDVGLPQDEVPSNGQANFSVTIQGGDLDSITAEVLDSQGQRIVMADLTPLGVGYGDLWRYSWYWKAESLKLSDDGSMLPMGAIQGGMLYLNQSSTTPITVLVNFDEEGKIALIQGQDDVVYYVSRYTYEVANPSLSYEELLEDEDLRFQLLKVEPGISKIQFYNVIDGNSVLESTNHTLTGSLESLEPHLMQVGIPPGQYEIRLTAKNSMGTTKTNDLQFVVSKSEHLSVSVGSATVEFGEKITVPLEVSEFEGEKQVKIAYNPEILAFENVSGCFAQSDLEDGTIDLVMPQDCLSLNLTFKPKKDNVTTEIGIEDLGGLEIKDMINGTITVLPEAKLQKEGKSNATSAFAALLILAMVTKMIKRNN